MADISVDPWTWSSTASSNSPTGATNIGTGLDDNLRAIQAGWKAAAEPLSSVSGTNTVVGTFTGLTAYATGQVFRFTPASTNTGATTLNVTSLGAKNVYFNNHALSGGEIVASVPVEVMYDGTQFQILGPSIGSAAQTFLGADVLLNNNANYFDGPNTGSIGAAGQKWKITAVMSVIDTAGAATIKGRIWDGTTVYTETVFTTSAANYEGIITAVAIVTLAGAATFYASCRDLTSNNGRIQTTGNAGTANKATYIIAERIS